MRGALAERVPPSGSSILRFTRALFLTPTILKSERIALAVAPWRPTTCPHVLRVHVKREQNAHLVDLAVDLHIIRMIHEGFYEIFEKFLIC